MVVTRFIFLVLFVSVQVPFALADPNQKDRKNVLMIAGARSHGYGAHEHFAGLKVLEPLVASEDVEVTVVRGWPEDDALVTSADSIVIYCDGGRRHLAIPHMKRLQEKLREGCGFACLHYGVETTKGPVGDQFIEMLGGHFETDWSVNPHWNAKFLSFPDHPITNGLAPFEINDEWYFHLRFKDSPHITPILAAIAPPETMRRPDGHHSGNPEARKSVAGGEPQTLAWTYTRPDNGRAFGFTGGHYHWNWASDPIRTIVARAIRWTAKVDLKVGEGKVTYRQLLRNQDYEMPKGFQSEETISKFRIPHSTSSNKASIGDERNQ